MAASSSLRQLLERTTQGLEQDPDNPKLRVEIAEILESMERPQDALTQYETAARLFVNVGLYREAAATCTRVLTLEPTHKEARRILQGIQRRGLADPEPTAPPTAAEPSVPAAAQRQVVVLDAPGDGSEQSTVSRVSTADVLEAMDVGAGALDGSTAAPGHAASQPAAAPDASPEEETGEVEAPAAAEVAALALDLTPVGTKELVSRSMGGLSATESDSLSPLAATSLLPLLPPEVATSGIQQPFAPGEVIVREDERSEQLFLLIEGRARVTRGEGEAAVTLGQLEQGAFFGELALLGDGRCHMTVQAVDPCTVLMIPRSQFKRLMLGSPEADRVVRSVYRDRLKMMALRTSPLFAPLHERVARRFLRQFVAVKSSIRTAMISEGAAAAGLYLVLLGELEVVARGTGTQEVHLAHLGPGDFFGALSTLRSRPCSATVRCRTFVQLLHLTPEVFHQFTDRHPRFKAMLDKEARRREKSLAGTLAR